MEEFTVYATLEIKAVGNGASAEDVLEQAVATKDYEIISSKIGSKPIGNYISLTEFAKMHNLESGIYLRKLCLQGKLPGAVKIGRNWCVPADTPYFDRRYTADGKWSGWYAKHGRKQYEKRKAAKAAQTDEEAQE